MVRRVLVVALALTACKKGGSTASDAPSTAANDALWALAPAGARGGVVMSPRALAMLEDGFGVVRKAMAAAPEMAPLVAEIDAALTRFGGSPQASLADFGLVRDKGAALFASKEGEMLMVLPVGNREKFIEKVHGTKGATPQDPDTIDSVTCKTVQGVYACAKPAALLDTMGQGALKAELGKLVTQRGELEAVGIELLGPAKSSLGITIAMSRGAFVAHGAMTNAPASITARLGKPVAVKASPTSAAFASVDLLALLGDLPIDRLAGNELAAVAKAVAGPLAIDVPAGAASFDATLPLTDAAPATALVAACESLPGVGPLAKLTNGVCHFPMPSLNLEIDMWVDGKALRLGKKGIAKGESITPTPVARELAASPWAFVFWGRGTVLGESTMPGMPPGGATLDPQTALVLRSLSMVNEIGVAFTVDGTTLKGVLAARSIFANSDTVVTKLLAIPPDDIAAARAGAKAKAVATANIAAPFATDFKSGQMGLSVPYMAIGLLAAVAIPRMMEELRPQRVPETRVHLGQLSKATQANFATTHAFPAFDIPLTPAESCCGKPDNTCPTADWAAWKGLGFAIAEPTHFRYSYKSDGKTFLATAVGDLDCDGTEVTHELRGSIVDDKPRVELVEPPDGDD